MSIEGSINVSALFHDKDGTTSLKVVSLRSSDEYTTGKVAIYSQTVGTASANIGYFGEIPSYVDASGNTVQFGDIRRIGFTWSGSNARRLSEIADSAFVMQSRNNELAITSLGGAPAVELSLNAGNQSGTITIIFYGT